MIIYSHYDVLLEKGKKEKKTVFVILWTFALTLKHNADTTDKQIKQIKTSNQSNQAE